MNRIQFIILFTVFNGFIHLAFPAPDDSTRIPAQEWQGQPRQTWEKIVSFPGTLLNLPFKLIFKTAEHTIAFVDNSQLIPRTQDLLESDDGLLGVVPTYASRNGGGIKFYRKGWLNPASKFTLTLMVGVHRRQKYEMEFKNLQLGPVQGKFWTHYQLLSDESFFGLGPETRYSDKNLYAHEQAAAAFSLEKVWRGQSGVTFQAGGNLNNILRGMETGEKSPNTVEIYTRNTLAGIGEQLRLGILEMQVWRDTRNHPGKPTAGGEKKIDGTLYQEIGGNDFGFWKIRGDFTQFVHLFYARTLKLRLAGEFTRPVSQRKIPFYYLSEFGEQSTIRGFERGRFRARDKIQGTLEYSYPLSQNQKKQSGIDAFLFVDSGQISDDLTANFDLSTFQTGLGGGVRIYHAEGISAQVQLGFCRDGYRFYFLLN